jgi:hypothetical protein
VTRPAAGSRILSSSKDEYLSIIDGRRLVPNCSLDLVNLWARFHVKEYTFVLRLIGRMVVWFRLGWSS